MDSREVARVLDAYRDEEPRRGHPGGGRLVSRLWVSLCRPAEYTSGDRGSSTKPGVTRSRG
jgi:hypothetical protein